MHTFIPYPADRAGVSLDNISPGAHHSAGGEVALPGSLVFSPPISPLNFLSFNELPLREREECNQCDKKAA